VDGVNWVRKQAPYSARAAAYLAATRASSGGGFAAPPHHSSGHDYCAATPSRYACLYRPGPLRAMYSRVHRTLRWFAATPVGASGYRGLSQTNRFYFLFLRVLTLDGAHLDGTQERPLPFAAYHPHLPVFYSTVCIMRHLGLVFVGGIRSSDVGSCLHCRCRQTDGQRDRQTQTAQNCVRCRPACRTALNAVAA